MEDIARPIQETLLSEESEESNPVNANKSIYQTFMDVSDIFKTLGNRKAKEKSRFLTEQDEDADNQADLYPGAQNSRQSQMNLPEQSQNSIFSSNSLFPEG